MSMIKHRRKFTPSVESMPSRAAASTITPLDFSDGGYHVFNGVQSGTIDISNHTTLLFLPGSTITGGGDYQQMFDGAISAQDSTIFLISGTINRSDDPLWGWDSMTAINCNVFLINENVNGTVHIVGGGSFYSAASTVTGSAGSFDSSGSPNGGDAIDAMFPDVFDIESGTYQAGNPVGSLGGLPAIILAQNGSETSVINGGVFIGGVNDIGDQGRSMSALMSENASLTINGGKFVGDFFALIRGSAKINFNGPDLTYSPVQSSGQFGSTYFNSTGTISGHLTNGDAISENLIIRTIGTPPTVTQTPGQIEFTA